MQWGVRKCVVSNYYARVPVVVHTHLGYMYSDYVFLFSVSCNALKEVRHVFTVIRVSSSPLVCATMSTPTTEPSVFERFEAYPFDSDPTFQAGLLVLLSSDVTTQSC